jgi:hypothetical protein
VIRLRGLEVEKLKIEGGLAKRRRRDWTVVPRVSSIGERRNKREGRTRRKKKEKKTEHPVLFICGPRTLLYDLSV